MHDNLLLQAFVYLAAAVAAVPIARRAGMGAVLGYLLAGIAIGPFGLRLVPGRWEVRTTRDRRLGDGRAVDTEAGLPVGEGVEVDRLAELEDDADLPAAVVALLDELVEAVAIAQRRRGGGRCLETGRRRFGAPLLRGRGHGRAGRP